jgi:hypothetical protein
VNAPSPNDSSTEAGAERLKAAILGYWVSRGKAPKVWVEEGVQTTTNRHHYAMHVVRSDMVCGLPRRVPA